MGAQQIAPAYPATVAVWARCVANLIAEEAFEIHALPWVDPVAAALRRVDHDRGALIVRRQNLLCRAQPPAQTEPSRLCCGTHVGPDGVVPKHILVWIHDFRIGVKFALLVELGGGQMRTLHSWTPANMIRRTVLAHDASAEQTIDVENVIHASAIGPPAIALRVIAQRVAVLHVRNVVAGWVALAADRLPIQAVVDRVFVRGRRSWAVLGRL